MKKLALLWKSFQNERWYHVGTLSFLVDEQGYEFSYTKDKEKLGIKEAFEHGFTLHPSFPDENKTYYSKRLFSAFSRRLSNVKRSDIFRPLRKLYV